MPLPGGRGSQFLVHVWVLWPIKTCVQWVWLGLRETTLKLTFVRMCGLVRPLLGRASLGIFRFQLTNPPMQGLRVCGWMTGEWGI